MAKRRHPHTGEEIDEPDAPEASETQHAPVATAADDDEPQLPKWKASPVELVKLLKEAYTPPETCALLEDWIRDDKKATIDGLLEKLFRRHFSYDGTIRKAYGILSEEDPRIVAIAMKKIYDKIRAENAVLEPIMGVTRVQ